ncbi:PPE domain-containing protein [Mycobacterium montefiorense]
MYSGAHSGPMLAAAAAWHELEYTASSFRATVTSLTAGPLKGPGGDNDGDRSRSVRAVVNCDSENAAAVALQTALSASIPRGGSFPSLSSCSSG